jgi:5-methylcytosine-specific restriction endonuclease McrA
MRKTTERYVKSALRRTWGKSKQRQGALKKAKVERGKYICACCGKVCRRKDIQVDHKVAVGRFIDFDTYIERLFCDSNGLQILCKSCHRIKTKKDIKSF